MPRKLQSAAVGWTSTMGPNPKPSRRNQVNKCCWNGEFLPQRRRNTTNSARILSAFSTISRRRRRECRPNSCCCSRRKCPLADRSCPWFEDEITVKFRVYEEYLSSDVINIVIRRRGEMTEMVLPDGSWAGVCSDQNYRDFPANVWWISTNFRWNLTIIRGKFELIPPG